MSKLEDSPSPNKKLVLYVNSGADNVKTHSANSFTYNLNPPIRLSPDSNPEVRVLQADVVYEQPNIMEETSLFISTFNGSNEHDEITYGIKVLDENTERTAASIVAETAASSTPLQTAVDNATNTYEIKFPAGLYSLADINQKIEMFCKDEPNLKDEEFVLVGSAPDQMISFDFDAENARDKHIYIHWTGYPKLADGSFAIRPNTSRIGEMCGFTKDSAIYHLTSEVKGHEIRRADSVAKFDTFQHYLLHMSSVASGYNEDGIGGSPVVAAISPDVSPGKAIFYRPVHPLPIAAPGMAGTTSSITFKLTTNTREPAHVTSPFSARILISW